MKATIITNETKCQIIFLEAGAVGSHQPTSYRQQSKLSSSSNT